MAKDTIAVTGSHGGEVAPQRPSFPVGRVLGFVAVWLGGSTLVVGATLRPVLPGGWVPVLAFMGFCALAVFVLMRGFSGAMYPSALTRLLIFRPFWYAMLFMPLLAGATLLAVVVALPFGASGVAGRWTIAVFGVVLTVASIAGFVGSKKLVVKRIRVDLPDLPEAFEGCRIVQISDLHVGPHTAPQFLARVANAVRSAKPDMIVITGDQVDDFPRDVEYFDAAFGKLAAPLGVYAVAGNHDVYAGWSAVRQGLVDKGFTVLVNEAVPIERDGQRIWLAGTGDPAGHGWSRGGGASVAPDIQRTLSGVASHEPTIVLAHNPALWRDIAQRGVSLTLSGHTHYGQLAIPRWGWSMASLFVHPSMGAHRMGDALLYINPGTNYWGLPFRLGTPPEVTVVTLNNAHTRQQAVIHIVETRTSTE